MRKALAIAAAIAVGSLMGGAAQAGVPTEQQDYVGVVGDLTVICNADPALNIGGACFNVNGSSVVVNVEDQVNAANVGFQVGWYNSDGSRNGPFIAQLCNSAELGVPEGAVAMKVFVDGPINGPADCNVAAPEGIGVLGTITVDWAVPQ